MLGCDIPERPPLRPVDAVPARIAEATKAIEQAEAAKIEPPGTPFTGQWETWDAYFVAEEHVGFSHVVAESAGSETDGGVRYQLESLFYKNRGRLRLLQHLSLTSTETIEGNLVDFQSVLRVGPVVTRFDGAINEGQLRIESVRGSERSTRTIPWDANYRGLVALEQSLRRRPMTVKDEQRTLKTLLPGQYELATARMRCSGEASVPLIDGAMAELIEINCELQVGESEPAYSTIWTNRDGSIVRTFSPAMQLVTYRTDEVTAKNFALNDMRAASVTIEGTVKQPEKARRVAYRIKSAVPAKEDESAPSVRPAPGQYVRQTDDKTIDILVSRRKETVAKGFIDGNFEPEPSHTQPNHFIDSNATSVRQIAKVAVGTRDSPREIVMELAQTVNRIVEDKPTEDGFTKASDVASYLVGDDLDRSVLLAALLRSRGIPSCLAFGLKYVAGSEAKPNGENRMVSHVWTMAHVNDKWLHVDPSNGKVAGADRLVLAVSDLSGPDEYNAWLPLLDTVPRLQIKVMGQN